MLELSPKFADRQILGTLQISEFGFQQEGVFGGKPAPPKPKGSGGGGPSAGEDRPPGGSSVRSGEHQLDATVRLTAFFGVVSGERIGVAVAGGV